jgi:hypothetical protein
MDSAPSPSPSAAGSPPPQAVRVSIRIIKSANSDQKNLFVFIFILLQLESKLLDIGYIGKVKYFVGYHLLSGISRLSAAMFLLPFSRS